MEIMPINKVRLIKGVPFTISYQDIIQFDNSTAQLNYFNSLPYLEIDNITYVRQTTKIKVPYNRESLLDYNYLYFQNSNYGDKIFYAFITNVEYVNPNTSAISFVIDEWQTWCFDITFMPTFIERKHCQRWNSDGSPVINTIDEGLDYGSEYITKDHEQYNNDLYWICFVTSLDNIDDYTHSVPSVMDVPTILTTFYLPIYKQTNSIRTQSTFNGTSLEMPIDILHRFRYDDLLVNKLVSCFIISEAPFNYTYSINDNIINITSNDESCSLVSVKTSSDSMNVIAFTSQKVPNRITHSFTKYDKLKNYVTESKLLMYPYSYVQLVDGQGNNFIIKPEYVNNSSINITTYTSAGLNSKQAHIVQDYRQQNVELNACRWELQNGIINSMPNNLTIVDDYSAAYIQGNANTISTNIANIQLQAETNNIMTQNTARANRASSFVEGIGTIGQSTVNGALMGDIKGGPGMGVGALIGAGQGLLQAGTNMISTEIQNKALIENTELQGNVSYEKAVASEMAKIQDAKMVADNVALQGGDVYFTYQNQFSGYCLVYRQISNEYIAILENYFKKYGYKVNTIEIPNLHTRESWNYIRTIDCNIKASINAESLEKLRTMFNNGVTVWHTTDVGNYTLSNNEI